MKKILLIIAFLLTGLTSTFGSHIPGGNISWACTGNPNEYLVTMRMYVSCPSNLSTTSYTGTITNTCGLANPTLVMPLLAAIPGGPSNPQEVSQICDADTSQSDCVTGTTGGIPGVREFIYQALVTLPAGCDSWDFAFSLCCRDANSNTAGGSGNTMYFHSQMNSVTAPCDASPYVTAQPIPYVCAGVQQTFCPGAIDPDGDSLAYSLVNPLGAAAAPIAYNLPYTVAAPLQNLVLDPVTGCITFNQPTTGNFVVTYLIEAFDAAGNMTGFIYHDFQFEVLNNVNCAPPVPPATGVSNLSGSGILVNGNTVEICEGQSFCFDVTFTDPDPTDILLLDSANTNIFTSMPGVVVTQSGTNPVTFNVCWTVPVGASANTQASIGVSDGSCPIENLASITIVVNVINSTVVNNPIILCGAQTAQLTAAGGTVFTWYYTATGVQVPVGPQFSCNPCANPIATPLVTTDYYVISNLSVGCNPSDSTTVTVVPDFTPTAYGDTLLCDFLTKQIGVNVNPAAAGYLYNWTNAGTLNDGTINNPIASPTQTTTYIATVTSPLGCVKTDTVTISVNPPPSVTLVPGDTTICQGETLQFDVSLTAIQDDFTGTFDPSVWGTVSGASVGNPCVGFSGTALNFNTATRQLITNSANVASCTSIDFCLWIANNVLSGAQPCENADANEDVELSYSTNGGATWVSIQIFDTDDWDAAGPYPNLWQCFSIPIPAGALTANSMFQWAQIGPYGGTIDNWALDNIAINCGGNTNYTYNWGPSTGLSNDTINNPIATPTVTTTYTVTLTDTGGCSVDRIQIITVAPNFATTVSQSAANTCLFDPIQLDVTVNPGGPGYTYIWTPSTFLDSDTIANPLATITTPGTLTYYVTTTGPGGCVKIDSITVVVSNSVAPTFTLTAADSLIFCGQQTQFTITPDTLIVAGNIDDFNGPLSTNWSSVVNGTQNTNCGSMTGNALHFDGTTTPREAVTIPQNVTSCTTVDFCLFMGNAGSGGAPCENADPGEDVELQYSVSGAGGPWITMQLYPSNDWDAAGPYNNSWACFSVPIPPGAQTATTLFKWTQIAFSACTGCDNWSLDDVSINCPSTSTNYNYAWTPNNGSLNDDTIQNPIGSPIVTTTYYVTVTDPNGGCTSSDSVTVYVDCGSCFPSAPTITNVTCKDGTDGQVIATPFFSPQNAQQVITWYDNSTVPPTLIQTSDTLYVGDTDTLIGVGAGSYTISTWDSISGGCVKDTIITITEPDSVMISTITTGSTICIGGSTNIDATATDGNGGPYTYTWTNLNTLALIPGNGPHTVNPTDTLTCYSVFATDPLGCISSTRQVCISLFDSITAMPVITSPIIDTLNICPTNPGTLGMTASGGNGGPYTYEWWESGALISTSQFPTVTPTGSFTIYTGYAYDNCGSPRGTVTIYVNWFGLVTPSFTRNKPDSCYPITIEFTNISSPAALILSSNWTVSNGSGGTGNTFTNTFDTPVCQDVTLSMTTVDGCFVDTTYVDYVCPYDYPIANFYMTPPITDLLNTEIEFTNLSTGMDLTYSWIFNSGLSPDISSAMNPTFIFSNTAPGMYPVSLTVTNNPYGCESTFIGTVVINGTYLFYTPNSFTPNGDGLNDVFRPYGEGIDLTQYSMQIFDRWGGLIFETSNASMGWDGTYKGKLLKVDTYVWKIVAKEEYSTIIHDNYGNVNLIK